MEVIIAGRALLGELDAGGRRSIGVLLEIDVLLLGGFHDLLDGAGEVDGGAGCGFEVPGYFLDAVAGDGALTGGSSCGHCVGRQDLDEHG